MIKPKIRNGSRIFVAKGEKKGNVRVEIPSSSFVFTQSTICSSVALEPKSFLIHPKTSRFVNNNGDCWSNESLRANYNTFIGSYNYVNHVQEPDKSVGFIADAQLRRIPIDPGDNLYVYYVDILTATHRDHRDLVQGILDNKIEFLSMGCEANQTICSKCGHVSDDYKGTCQHIDGEKGKYFIDSGGNRRIVAEILGTGKPGTCNFIEASWLTEVPAFHGAAKRHVLSIPNGKTVSVDMSEEAFQRDATQKFLNIGK